MLRWGTVFGWKVSLGEKLCAMRSCPPRRCGRAVGSETLLYVSGLAPPAPLFTSEGDAESDSVCKEVFVMSVLQSGIFGHVT